MTITAAGTRMFPRFKRTTAEHGQRAVHTLNQSRLTDLDQQLTALETRLRALETLIAESRP